MLAPGVEGERAGEFGEPGGGEADVGDLFLADLLLEERAGLVVDGAEAGSEARGVIEVRALEADRVVEFSLDVL